MHIFVVTMKGSAAPDASFTKLEEDHHHTGLWTDFKQYRKTSCAWDDTHTVVEFLFQNTDQALLCV